MPELTRTLCSIIPPSDRHTYQFTAILGDLLHKQDCYLLYGDYGKSIEDFFTNEHQAKFLRSYFPKLVPEPAQPGQEPSDHTLGTVFEFHYFSDLHFRLIYRDYFLKELAPIYAGCPITTTRTPLSTARPLPGATYSEPPAEPLDVCSELLRTVGLSSDEKDVDDFV